MNSASDVFAALLVCGDRPVRMYEPQHFDGHGATLFKGLVRAIWARMPVPLTMSRLMEKQASEDRWIRPDVAGRPRHHAIAMIKTRAKRRWEGRVQFDTTHVATEPSAGRLANQRMDPLVSVDDIDHGLQFVWVAKAGWR